MVPRHLCLRQKAEVRKATLLTGLEGYYLGECSLNIVVPQKISTFTTWFEAQLKILLLTAVFSPVTELSLRLSSHSAAATISQSAGLVETAQQIRTMAIKLEEGVLEEGGGGGGCETQGKEKVEEAEEQLEVTPFPPQELLSFPQDLEKVKLSGKKLQVLRVTGSFSFMSAGFTAC